MFSDYESVRLEADLFGLRSGLFRGCSDFEVACNDLEADLLRTKVGLCRDRADLISLKRALSRDHATFFQELVRIEHALTLM
jgi:hypothetical protein